MYLAVYFRVGREVHTAGYEPAIVVNGVGRLKHGRQTCLGRQFGNTRVDASCVRGMGDYQQSVGTPLVGEARLALVAEPGAPRAPRAVGSQQQPRPHSELPSGWGQLEFISHKT